MISELKSYGLDAWEPGFATYGGMVKTHAFGAADRLRLAAKEREAAAEAATHADASDSPPPRPEFSTAAIV